MIQVQINYNNNVITVKEGTNFKINLISSLFRRGNVVSVVAGGKTTQYRLQQDANYAKNNMKLFCDPNYGFDSYVTVGNFQPEVNVGYLPQPPQPAAQGQYQQQIPQQIPQQSYYQQQIPPGYGFQQQGYGQAYPGVFPQQAYPGYGGFPQQQFGGYGRRVQQFGGYRQYYY